MDYSPANEYADKVLSGEIPSCKFVKQACQRFLNDLEVQEEKGWRFSIEHGQYVVDFIERFIPHTVGEWAGKPMMLELWQKFVIMNLFGWYKSNGNRRFTSSYIAIPKKNGKTTLGAAISLFMLIGDHEPTAEIYYAATKRDQAKICFDEAARMVKKSPALRRIAEAMKNSIVFEALESSAKALSSDRDSMDGLRAYCAIIDEYHQHKDSIVSDELMSTMAIRRSPLHFTITTAGFNLTYPCRKLQRMCERLLDGKQQDDSLFTIIYSIDEEDDWKDPETWIKANPNYGVSMSAESFEVAFQKAYNSGGRKEVEFKTKRLNKWVESEVVWISKEKWKACKREVDWSAFDSHPVWLGLDLASKADMTALSCVYEYGGEVYIKNYYFLPEDLYSETIEDDPNHIYKSFEDFDRLILTPGNVTDYDYIRKLISGNWTGGDIDPECIAEKNDIEVLGYDKFNASQLVIYLTDDGVSCDPFPNTFGHMNEPTKELERLVLSQNLVHDGDPILEWMLSNVFIRMDHNGNIKPDKQRSQNKIDGVVSLVMALGEYVNDNFEGPETFEIRLL